MQIKTMQNCRYTHTSIYLCVCVFIDFYGYIKCIYKILYNEKNSIKKIKIICLINTHKNNLFLNVIFYFVSFYLFCIHIEGFFPQVFSVEYSTNFQP